MRVYARHLDFMASGCRTRSIARDSSDDPTDSRRSRIGEMPHRIARRRAPSWSPARSNQMRRRSSNFSGYCKRFMSGIFKCSSSIPDGKPRWVHLALGDAISRLRPRVENKSGPAPLRSRAPTARQQKKTQKNGLDRNHRRGAGRALTARACGDASEVEGARGRRWSRISATKSTPAR